MPMILRKEIPIIDKSKSNISYLIQNNSLFLATCNFLDDFNDPSADMWRFPHNNHPFYTGSWTGVNIYHDRIAINGNISEGMIF